VPIGQLNLDESTTPEKMQCFCLFFTSTNGLLDFSDKFEEVDIPTSSLSMFSSDLTNSFVEFNLCQSLNFLPAALNLFFFKLNIKF
jgi:hypothetical protein